MFQQQKPRIAIIGSGITGVSAACQVLDAGLECRIFEAQDERSVGGIWARQNATSSIQIPSDFYTFHPKVQWSSEYPQQAEVLHQTRRLWDLYHLESMTFFHCPVTKVERFDGRYVINEKSFGAYDAIIVAVGTCARLSIPEIPGRDDYSGQAVHSSDLGSVDMADKRVLIIGGGASTVEAMEHAHSSGAASVTVITRSDKWVVPRWRLLNCIMALIFFDPFGLFNMIFTFFLRVYCYRGLPNVAPENNGKTLYSQTPVVNSRFFEIIVSLLVTNQHKMFLTKYERSGAVTWLKGDYRRFMKDGLQVIPRSSAGSSQSTPYIEKCDVCIYATGYERPSLGFLNDFANGYHPPSWFLQVFPPGTPTICAINSTWVHGIGSVGAGHIGMYTRLLLTYTLDLNSRPSLSAMSFWIWIVDKLKPTQGLGFVTTAEVYIWFLLEIAFNPALWRWGRFIVCGDRDAPQVAKHAM